jgi:hypothetical protein
MWWYKYRSAAITINLILAWERTSDKLSLEKASLLDDILNVLTFLSFN